MDIAKQLVVMNNGKIEQTGTATELYEKPANEFVMSFVGEVNQLGEHLVRPHDLEILAQANGQTEQATVIRVVGLGFEVRVELDLGDGKEIWAQLTREQAEQLDLRDGQTVFVRPERTKVFSGPQAS